MLSLYNRVMTQSFFPDGPTLEVGGRERPGPRPLQQPLRGVAQADPEALPGWVRKAAGQGA